MSALGRGGAGAQGRDRRGARRRHLGGVLRLPGHPELSLLRAAAAEGYTAIALDRPGYGASAVLPRHTTDPADAPGGFALGAVDKILGDSSRGAGLFLLAHSAGCELGLRMAVDDRATDVMGVELSGTGLRYGHDGQGHHQRGHRHVAARRSAGSAVAAHRPLSRRGADRRAVGAGRGYEAEVTANWPRRDFAEIAARVTVPVEFSVADHERVWESTPRGVGTPSRHCSRRRRGSSSTKCPTADTISASAGPRTNTTGGCCRSSRNASLPPHHEQVEAS